MLLLPMLLAAGFSAPPAHRYAAQGVSVLCLAALAVSQTRSAWIGEVVALTTFAFLYFWSGAGRNRSALTDGERQRRKALALPYIILGAGALIGFLALAPQRDAVVQRLQSLTTTVPQGREASVEWRFGAWRGARQMITDRPLPGVGDRLLPARPAGLHPGRRTCCRRSCGRADHLGPGPRLLPANGRRTGGAGPASLARRTGRRVCHGPAGAPLPAGGRSARVDGDRRAVGPGRPGDRRPGQPGLAVRRSHALLLDHPGIDDGGGRGRRRGGDARGASCAAVPLRLLQILAALAAGGWLAVEAIGGARLLPAPHL